MHLRISSHTESSWPLAVTVLALCAFLLGLTRTGQQFCDELSEHFKRASTLEQPAPSRPDVLLVTAKPTDQLVVAATVSPRGYKLVFAANTATGIELLRSHARSLGLISSTLV